MSDLGPPLSLSNMRDILAAMLGSTETQDGNPTRTALYLLTEDVRCLRRVHKLLESLAPHQDRVRKIVSGGR